jgi:hypothetical protein
VLIQQSVLRPRKTGTTPCPAACCPQQVYSSPTMEEQVSLLPLSRRESMLNRTLATCSSIVCTARLRSALRRKVNFFSPVPVTRVLRSMILLFWLVSFFGVFKIGVEMGPKEYCNLGSVLGHDELTAPAKRKRRRRGYVVRWGRRAAAKRGVLSPPT